MIELVVLDVSGTTVDEHGLGARILADVVCAAGGRATPSQLEAWIGAGEREAIRGLLRAGRVPTSSDLLDTALTQFRARLAEAYRLDPPMPFPGVTEVVAALRHNGIRVALTTGFERSVAVPLLARAGWGCGVVDALVCEDDVPAGRPAPFMIFRAMEATGVLDVRRVLVAGDTIMDIEAGLNSGAQVVAAVTTGDTDAAALRAAGPTHVLRGAVDLPALLTRLGQPVSAPALHA